MYIYIDETFNLQKGTKNQFMAVAGFATENSHDVARWYQKLKRKALPNKFVAKEIKSNHIFTKIYIIPAIFSNKIVFPKMKLFTAIQRKNILPQKYFLKSNLNYDLLYLDLLQKLLLKACNPKDKDVVIITLDTFKTKIITKEDISNNLITNLKLKYPNTNFSITFGTSEEKNLQFADQVCGIVHDYLNGDEANLKKIKRMLPFSVIENPL